MGWIVVKDVLCSAFYGEWNGTFYVSSWWWECDDVLVREDVLGLDGDDKNIQYPAADRICEVSGSSQCHNTIGAK